MFVVVDWNPAGGHQRHQDWSSWRRKVPAANVTVIWPVAGQIFEKAKRMPRCSRSCRTCYDCCSSVWLKCGCGTWRAAFIYCARAGMLMIHPRERWFHTAKITIIIKKSKISGPSSYRTHTHTQLSLAAVYCFSDNKTLKSYQSHWRKAQ